MTIEQVKAGAKKRFGQELTDEQAEAILENHSSEELSAQVLEEVAGGANNIKITYVDRNMPEEMPNVYLLLEQMNEEATRRLKSYGSGELSAQELEDVAGGAYYQLDVCPNSTQWGTINIYNTEELSPQELEEVTGGVNKVKITYVDYIERNKPKSPQFEPHVIPFEEIKDWHLTHERIEDWIKGWLDAHDSKELSEE